ncbi:hypothetical protein [Streptomyces tremellae]|uniref:Uncharacterized protein n=1 Tax=Streptomyces tremellae TaxID=1124239 RepID=A0ABP7F377_9ACTN
MRTSRVYVGVELPDGKVHTESYGTVEVPIKADGTLAAGEFFRALASLLTEAGAYLRELYPVEPPPGEGSPDLQVDRQGTRRGQ